MKHLIPITAVAALAFLIIFLSNLSTPPTPVMHPINLADLSPYQHNQHQRAMSAQKEMFQTLMARLTTAMQSGGPPNAISVCSTDAKTIADQVSKEHNLTIARTTSKLRNQSNAPPQWATKPLESNPTEPLILTNELGHLALINPIKLAPTCLKCHGSTTTDITPETQAALKNLYPNDQATGYNDGDLRGWFTIYIH